MNINYAELYGVWLNESDFNGAIERALKNNTRHLDEKFIEMITEICTERRQIKAKKKRNTF